MHVAILYVKMIKLLLWYGTSLSEGVKRCVQPFYSWGNTGASLLSVLKSWGYSPGSTVTTAGDEWSICSGCKSNRGTNKNVALWKVKWSTCTTDGGVVVMVVVMVKKKGGRSGLQWVAWQSCEQSCFGQTCELHKSRRRKELCSGMAEVTSEMLETRVEQPENVNWERV